MQYDGDCPTSLPDFMITFVNHTGNPMNFTLTGKDYAVHVSFPKTKDTPEINICGFGFGLSTDDYIVLGDMFIASGPF